MAFVITGGKSHVFNAQSVSTAINTSSKGFWSTPDTKENEQKRREIMNLVDPAYELIDPTPNIHELFVLFTDQLFFGALGACTVEWSKRMTTCAGICSYQTRTGLCSIRLSEPLLKLRPRKDLIETLLHEMIHAYLFVTQRVQDHDGHGPNFQEHMHRINRVAGTNITIYHSFHAEVAVYKQHWWRCEGVCRQRAPYHGWVKRSMNRAPGPADIWWKEHASTCGGKFIKVKEPEKTTKTLKAIENTSSQSFSKSNSLSAMEAKVKGMLKKEMAAPDLPRQSKIDQHFFPGVGKILGIDQQATSSSTSQSSQPKTDPLFPGKSYTLGGGETLSNSTKKKLKPAANTSIISNVKRKRKSSINESGEIFYFGDVTSVVPKKLDNEIVWLD